MPTDTIRAVNMMCHDVVILDGRAVELIEAKHRWRYGVQYVRIRFREAGGAITTRELDPEARYPIVVLARH